MVRRTYQLSWLEHVNGHAEHTAFRVWGNFVISLPDGRKLKSHGLMLQLAPLGEPLEAFGTVIVPTGT